MVYYMYAIKHKVFKRNAALRAGRLLAACFGAAMRPNKHKARKANRILPQAKTVPYPYLRHGTRDTITCPFCRGGVAVT